MLENKTFCGIKSYLNFFFVNLVNLNLIRNILLNLNSLFNQLIKVLQGFNKEWNINNFKIRIYTDYNIYIRNLNSKCAP